MKFRTETTIPDNYPSIHYGEAVFSIGSCFSVEIAYRLKQLKYKVLQNPAGITFNPVSISRIIKMVKNGNSLPEESLIFNGFQWCHPDFHGSFNHFQKDKVLDDINQSISSARNFMKDVKHLVITLGTSVVYESRGKGTIVNNCHKLPADNFNKRFLRPGEIVEALEETIQIISELSEQALNIFLTVSPVRHTREGLHNNQLSKARCLLAIDNLCKRNEQCYYFPSYEIILDELRDYRFYKEDMIHPTKQAVDFIFEKFEEKVLDAGESILRNKIRKINKSLEHKAFDPDSRQHQEFLKKLEEDIVEIRKRHPELYWD